MHGRHQLRVSDYPARLGSRRSRVVLASLLNPLLLSACDGAPSRNILGSYFPSWMVCAILGLVAAALARVLFRVTGVLDELPFPALVFLAIGCAATFATWLIWLA